MKDFLSGCGHESGQVVTETTGTSLGLGYSSCD